MVNPLAEFTPSPIRITEMQVNGKLYANDYPANTIDYAMCEAEEVAVIQTLLL